MFRDLPEKVDFVTISQLCALSTLIFKVVKAFVVLAPNYTSHDPETLIKELQDHVKKITAPYKYPRKVSLISPMGNFYGQTAEGQCLKGTN